MADRWAIAYDIDTVSAKKNAAVTSAVRLTGVTRRSRGKIRTDVGASVAHRVLCV